MQIPRFILVTFLALLVGGTVLATALLVSSSEPHLGDSIVMTPEGTPPPDSPPSTLPDSPSETPTGAPSENPANPESPANPPETPEPPALPVNPAPSPSGAVEVPACAPLTGDEDCDDDWEDYWDDYWDDLDDN